MGAYRPETTAAISSPRRRRVAEEESSCSASSQFVVAIWSGAGSFRHGEETVFAAALGERAYAAVVIGAGIRVPPPMFLPSERLVNLVHQRAPGAGIGFNTKPEDTLEAMERAALAAKARERREALGRLWGVSGVRRRVVGLCSHRSCDLTQPRHLSQTTSEGPSRSGLAP
jgi:hypothetical protein